MDKGLVFFTLAGVLLWLILDDFFGQGKVQDFAAYLTPDLSLGNVLKDGVNGLKKSAGEVNDYEKKKAGWTDADMKKVEAIQKKIANGEKVTWQEYQFLFDHTLQG